MPNTTAPVYQNSIRAVLKRSQKTLWICTALLLICCVLFMTLNSYGNWDFILPLRGKKLLLLITIGYAVGVSTLLFQTLTHNPILTPSILGFDQLYLLLQSFLVLVLGNAFTQINMPFKFAIETCLMTVCALILFRTLTAQTEGSLSRMILVGVIFGVLFRSLNNLIERILDPASFAIAQSQSFAQFNTVDMRLVIIAIVIAVISSFFIWKKRHILDILMLGRNNAVNLGVAYQRETFQILILVSVLVSCSTALVGPISFFGLFVCAIVNNICRSFTHKLRLPLAFCIASITLVFGQTVFEQILGYQGVLSVVIELLGGLVFLWLLLKRRHQR